jgi:hypothetical protein
MRLRAALVNFGATDGSRALSYSSVIRCLALILLLTLGAGCGKKKTAPRPTPSPSPGASPAPIGAAVSEAQWTVWKNGKRLLTLSTEAAEIQPDTKGKLSARLSGQKATLYRNGSPLLALTGAISADESANMVTVREGRVVAYKTAANVSSDTVIWNRTAGTIRGTGNVRVTLDGTTLQGKSFVADERLTRIEIDQ